MLFAAVDDAVVDLLFFDEFADTAVVSHAIDQIQMVIVPVGHGLLRVNVLTERGLEISALKVMGGKGVPRKDRVHIIVFDQAGHRSACVGIEGKGGAHDPDDLAVVALVAQQLIELIIIARKCRLA